MLQYTLLWYITKHYTESTLFITILFFFFFFSSYYMGIDSNKDTCLFTENGIEQDSIPCTKDESKRLPCWKLDDKRLTTMSTTLLLLEI